MLFVAFQMRRMYERHTRDDKINYEQQIFVPVILDISCTRIKVRIGVEVVVAI